MPGDRPSLVTSATLLVSVLVQKDLECVAFFDREDLREVSADVGQEVPSTDTALCDWTCTRIVVREGVEAPGFGNTEAGS